MFAFGLFTQVSDSGPQDPLVFIIIKARKTCSYPSGLTESDLYRCDNCKAASNCLSQIPGPDRLYQVADDCMRRCISAGVQCKLAVYHNVWKSCDIYTCSDIAESTGYISYRYSKNRGLCLDSSLDQLHCFRTIREAYCFFRDFRDSDPFSFKLRGKTTPQ